MQTGTFPSTSAGPAGPAKLPPKSLAAVPAALAAHAAQTPKRIALVAPEGSWTYADLHARVRALHERLRRFGVLHGDRVIIAMDRGADLVAAMLAVSRAGATYVPVDPGHPPARTEAVIAQAAPRCALADGIGAQALTTNIDTIRTDRMALPTGVPPSPVPVFPEAAAYMLFTSGSTGRPKGVVIPHRALETFIASVASRLRMGPHDHVMAATTVGFDISVLEIFVPLTLGATVHLVSTAVSEHPGRLRDYLASHPISTLQATPTRFRLLISAGWAGRPDLKIFCGGEAMTPELAAQLLDRGGEVWNLYGPTECTVWATAHRLTREAPEPYLGAPLDGTRLMVVDDDGFPSDDGELVICGDQVGTGYFRDPVKTDASFIADPEAPSRFAYRTGDRVKQSADGLMFCGRLDSQVKVRGVRLELGDIEAKLLQQPAIAQCTVLHDAERDELHAYGVLTEGYEAPDPVALRTHLEISTFKAGCPAQYTWLSSMPLTATGKVDRKALANLEKPKVPTLGADAPSNDLERLVASAWRHVLRLSGDPGRSDAFTTLGGTSFKFLEVVLRIERWLEIKIPTASFMMCQTVAAQAAFLEDLREREAGLDVGRLRDGDGTPLFAVCGVKIYEPIAACLNGTMPAFGVSVPLERAMHEGVDVPTVQAVADETVAAIRAIRPHGPYRLAGASYGGVVAFETALCLRAAGEPVEGVVVFDSVLPHALHASLLRKMAVFARDRARAIRPKNASVLNSTSRWTESAEESLDQYMSTFRGLVEDLPVLVLRARDRNDGIGRRVDPDLGWNRMVRGAAVKEVPGDHMGMLRGEGASVCADAARSFFQLSGASSQVSENEGPSSDTTVKRAKRSIRGGPTVRS